MRKILLTAFVFFLFCGCSAKTYTKPDCFLNCTADFYIDNDKVGGTFIFSNGELKFTVTYPENLKDICFTSDGDKILCIYDNISFEDNYSPVYKAYSVLKLLNGISTVTVPEFATQSGDTVVISGNGTVTSILFSSGERVEFN